MLYDDKQILRCRMQGHVRSRCKARTVMSGDMLHTCCTTILVRPAWIPVSSGGSFASQIEGRRGSNRKSGATLAPQVGKDSVSHASKLRLATKADLKILDWPKLS